METNNCDRCKKGYIWTFEVTLSPADISQLEDEYFLGCKDCLIKWLETKEVKEALKENKA